MGLTAAACFFDRTVHDWFTFLVDLSQLCRGVYMSCIVLQNWDTIVAHSILKLVAHTQVTEAPAKNKVTCKAQMMCSTSLQGPLIQLSALIFTVAHQVAQYPFDFALTLSPLSPMSETVSLYISDLTLEHRLASQ